ncbi:tripartite motif-containing protein 2-like [Asterias rubens]|uniref:tripartite motif-containing protein 2-like n=1 Tax=Asterias rubens TaxID=7604 RepID=UPI001455506B|nr:tripartite motif-containing protein 2-like [Asterias rubens]
MAEGVSTDPLLSKVIQGHLECSICCTRYNQPKNLDCSHSYCLKCLQELKKTQNPDTNKLKCPLCQKETILPLDGVTGLQSNYLLIVLVEEVNKQDQLPQGEESKVMCQACDEENAAISRCLNCEHYLCLECQKAHPRLAALKNHEIKTLAELQEVDETQTESKMNISRCDIHPIQELCLYCMTCEQLICKVCAKQHRAPIHTIVDLKSATEKSIQEIIDGASQLDRSSYKLTSRLELLLHSLSIKIRNMEKNLLQEASDAGSRKGKTLSKLIFANESLKIVQSSNTAYDSLKILKNRQKHLHDYINIDEEEVEDLTYDLSFLSFKESKDGMKGEMGTLLLKEIWGEMLTAKVSGSFIGAFSTDCMIVMGKEDATLTIMKPDGNILQTYGKSWLSGNLENPNSLAVNKDDHVIILDGPNVKTFGSNCRLLHEFTPGKGSDSKPTCLAVDENNLIAVGYKDKGEVSLHNPDGSLIRTLSAPGIDEYMVISNQRIIYTSPNDGALMCFYLNDTKCQTLFRYVDATPYGICCDKVGDVYVVYEGEPKPDTSAKESGCVTTSAAQPARSVAGRGALQPSRGGRGGRHERMAGPGPMKHCICRYRFGTDPTILARSNSIFHDVTYTPGGHLAVVGGNCTKLYQRVNKFSRRSLSGFSI